MKYVWDEHAWADYLWCQAQDRKVLKRINMLLQDVVRNGNEGIGKPEPLRHALAGWWSRLLPCLPGLGLRVKRGRGARGP